MSYEAESLQLIVAPFFTSLPQLGPLLLNRGWSPTPPVVSKRDGVWIGGRV